MDALIREVVKYHGRKSIKYMQLNNRIRFLLPLPSARTTERYIVEFEKRGCIIDEITDLIATSAQCTKEEAAECLVCAVFNEFKEPFVKVSMEKGIMPNVHCKMDTASVEAMLCEAGLNTKNSRVLFKHLNQFFGKGFFESEKKCREYFAGQDFPPVIDRKVLEDKSTVHYWYKQPDLLIKHQLGKIISPDQLGGLKRWT
jgi:hypothetical protein